jgi:hypothetical protein
MPNYYSKHKYPDADHIRCGFLPDQRRWFERAQTGTSNATEPHLRLMRCMFGEEGSTNELLGSNGLERTEIVGGLADAIKERIRDTNQSIAKVSIAHVEWCAPGPVPTIDVASIRFVSTVLKKLAPSSVAAIRIGCLPVHEDPGRFQFKAVVQAILVGNDLEHSAPIAAAPLQRRYQALDHDVSPIQFAYPKTGSDRIIAAASASLLDMGDPFAAGVIKRLGKKRAKDWSRSSKRRALERLKILSLCRLDRLLLATGSFEPVLASLRAGAQARVRRRYQTGDKSLHPDALVHFWADPLLRAPDEALSLPFVKQRK